MNKKATNDFVFGRTLGEGSYSTVIYATEVSNNQEFAVKICDKKQITREKKVKYVTIEKDVLNLLVHDFIIKLYYTFQDSASLYFVLEYAPNGDLLQLLRIVSKFSVPVAQFYSAEIISAVEYIHSMGILHRDIKPENVLLDKNMHIKITDFGSAKFVQSHSESSNDHETHSRKASFVGTAEYCCPELLNDRETSEKSDVWSIGCLLFQLLSGRHPFRGANEYQTFQKVLNLEYVFPMDFDLVGMQLLKCILVLDPNSRYSLDQVKKSEFYLDVEWDKLRTLEPPSAIIFERNREISTNSVLNSEVSYSELENGLCDMTLEESIESENYELSESPNSDDVSPVKSDNIIHSELNFQEYLDGQELLGSYIIKRRSHFRTKERILLITKDSFIFVNPQKKLIHSQILVQDIINVQIRDENRISLILKKGIIHLQITDKSAVDFCNFWKSLKH